MADAVADLEIKAQGLPPPERPPSLLEKLVNLRQAWQSVPTEEIEQEFKSRHRWSRDWKTHWLDCSSPMATEWFDGIEIVSQQNGDVWLAPTARRCGKTT